MTTGSTLTRRRDSAATRQSLLEAAAGLFGSKGYEATTIREIAERAGADSALIARYFGNKAGLYVAVLSAEAIQYQGTTIAASVPEVVGFHLARTDSTGVGPITQALLSSETVPEVRQAAAGLFQRRLVSRLVAQMPEHLADRQLRAEVAMAALMGAMFMRGRGGFDQLAHVPAADLEPILADMLLAVLDRPTES